MRSRYSRSYLGRKGHSFCPVSGIANPGAVTVASEGVATQSDVCFSRVRPIDMTRTNYHRQHPARHPSQFPTQLDHLTVGQPTQQFGDVGRPRPRGASKDADMSRGRLRQGPSTGRWRQRERGRSRRRGCVRPAYHPPPSPPAPVTRALPRTRSRHVSSRLLPGISKNPLACAKVPETTLILQSFS